MGAHDRSLLVERRVVPAALLASLAVAVLLALVEPLAEGHNYLLAVRLVVLLGAVWFVCLLRPRLLVCRAFLAAIVVTGLALGVAGMLTIDADAEIVRVYDSVIETVDEGLNPYTSGTIYHRDADGRVVDGNFNYPPLELYPVLVAHHLTGQWDSGVLAGLIVIVNLLACAVLAVAFRRELPLLWPWFPLLALLEVKVMVSMTFLVVALAVWAVKAAGPSPSTARRILIAVLFGVGLTAKFLVIPIFLAYLWQRFDRRRLASLRPLVLEGAVAAVASLVLIAPFGPVAVLRSTLLFNLALDDRAEMTTFYPNVVSGLCEWLGLTILYPVLAVAVLAAALWVAPRLDVWAAMVVATYGFLLASPTPEPQYVPIVLALGLVTAYQRRELEWERWWLAPAAPWAVTTGRVAGGRPDEPGGHLLSSRRCVRIA